MSTHGTGSGLGRGVVAGAVGTLVLDAVTYLDMALRGRPASDLPSRTVEAGLDAAGLQVDLDQNRSDALGALAGMATGVGIGAVMGVARSYGVRLSPSAGAAVTAALAMATSDGSATALGLTDPRSWSAQDWLADLVPHVAYGTVTHQVLVAQERAQDAPEPTRPSAGLLTRSLLLGIATGSRSTLGLMGAVGSTRVKALATAAAGAELVADKLPSTPSRLEPQGLVPRFGAAAIGATGLAARDDSTVHWPVLAGALGAAVGSFGGAAWREAAAERMPDWAAGGVEDVVALGLAWVACRR